MTGKCKYSSASTTDNITQYNAGETLIVRIPMYTNDRGIREKTPRRKFEGRRGSTHCGRKAKTCWYSPFDARIKSGLMDTRFQAVLRGQRKGD